MQKCFILIKDLVRKGLNKKETLKLKDKSKNCMACIKIKKNETCFINLKESEEVEYKPVSIHTKNRLIAMRIPLESSSIQESNTKEGRKMKKKSKKQKKVVIVTRESSKTYSGQKLWAQAYIYGGR